MASTDLMEKLFRWKQKVELFDTGVVLWQRIVGDSVVDDARRMALLESRKLRMALRDPETDDYIIYMDAIIDMTDDELIDGIVGFSSRDVMRDYLQQTPRPEIQKLSDYPSQEEQEEYEAAKTERETAYFADMQAYVDDWREHTITGLTKRDRRQLEARYAKFRVDRICDERFNTVFEAHVVVNSLYLDNSDKTRELTSC